MGWFTCNPIFAERLERQAETSTQAPCGFGQVFLMFFSSWVLTNTNALVTHYSNADQLAVRRIFAVAQRWSCFSSTFTLLNCIIPGLGVQYKQRRNFFIDCLAKKFHLEMAPPSYGFFEGSPTYFASQMRRGYHNEKANTKVLFSFVPPTSGMFIWVGISIWCLLVSVS